MVVSMTQTEALRLALEALEKISMGGDPRWADQAITAIKAALEAKHEPVAWLHRFIEGGISIGLKPLDLERHPERWQPLYTTPPQQELVCVCGAVWEGQELVETPPQRTWLGLTPACPQGLTEYACEVEGVDLVCFLEYTPDEEGSRDSRGLLDEPGTFENLELLNAYVKGTDVDIGHLLLQYLVDHITTTALEDFKNDDL
jgi:hypothetical protein